MVVRRETSLGPAKTTRPVATTPEGRETQMAALAYDAIEKRIREGTASAQELVHFAKSGSPREQLELQRIKHENELAQAKIEALASARRVEELYTNAILAMRGYSGQDPTEPLDEYQD